MLKEFKSAPSRNDSNNLQRLGRHHASNLRRLESAVNENSAYTFKHKLFTMYDSNNIINNFLDCFN